MQYNKQNTMQVNRNSMREPRTNQLMQNMPDNDMQQPLLQNYNQPNQMMGGGMDNFNQQQMWNNQQQQNMGGNQMMGGGMQ